MYKAYRVGYEYGPYQGDSVYVIAKNIKEATDIAVAYLKEEYLWERVGYQNMGFYQVDKIPPKELIIF